MIKLFPFLLGTNFPFLMPFIPYASYLKKVCEALEFLVSNFCFFLSLQLGYGFREIGKVDPRKSQA